MADEIVRGIQYLSLELVGDDRGGSIVFLPGDSSIAVFTGKQTALVVEGIAVGITHRMAEGADMAIFFEPAKLAVIRNVAPDNKMTLRAPGGSFGPEGSGMEAENGSVSDPILVEALVERDDVRLRIANRRVPRIIPGLLGEQRGSRHGAEHRAQECPAIRRCL